MLTLEDLAGHSRIIAIDAETTGGRTPTPAEVARLPKAMPLPGLIIQLACVELLRDGDGWVKGETWDSLINPDAPIRAEAARIHGFRNADLRHERRFRNIRAQFEAFIGDAPLLAHGACNEMAFLNYEMRRAKFIGWDQVAYRRDRFIDTQTLGAAAFPGATQTLDALCDRLWIDRSDRFKHHGALLDADLTAEAFIKLAGGFVQDEVRTLSFG